MKMGHWQININIQKLNYRQKKNCVDATVSTKNPAGLALDRIRRSEYTVKNNVVK